MNFFTKTTMLGNFDCKPNMLNHVSNLNNKANSLETL